MNIKEWEARCVLPIFSTGDNMFELQGNLKFVNVDIDYVKKLHTACSEVYILNRRMCCRNMAWFS